MPGKNELTVLDPNTSLVPSADDIAVIMETIKDIDRVSYGRIKFPSGGSGVFKVTEIGEETSKSVTEVVGVVAFSQKCNALWTGKYGTPDANKTPDCSSIDGETGVITETGECRACATCPHNQFGSDPEGGPGKACKNMRRLFILRDGDILPMVLSLPSTAIKTYDNYRLRLANMRKLPDGVVTKISLKSTKNAGGTEYDAAVFEPTAFLPPAVVERVKQYAASFAASIKHSDIADDANAPQSAPSKPCPVNAQNGKFVEVNDEEMPF